MVGREGNVCFLMYSFTKKLLLKVFIVSYCRTPLGVAFTGSLSHLSAPELASHAIRGT